MAGVFVYDVANCCLTFFLFFFLFCSSSFLSSLWLGWFLFKDMMEKSVWDEKDKMGWWGAGWVGDDVM